MRTVYLGTTDFAARVLERLADSPHRPALVVTRPDRPRGRGRHLASPPVADAARALGLALDQPQSVNEDAARQRIAAAQPDTVCICAFGALIKEPLLSAHPMLNVHPSLLPRWRGAAPIERAIEAGDTETGVSIMRPVAQMDAGPVCLARAEPIRPDDDYGSLSGRLREVAADLLIKTLDDQPPCEEQPDEGVTVADKIGPGDRGLDPEASPAEALALRVRALTPHIGAHVHLGAGRGTLGVNLAVPVTEDAAGVAPAALMAREGRLLLGCANATVLELVDVKPEGGRAMPAADWLRGRGKQLLA